MYRVNDKNVRPVARSDSQSSAKKDQTVVHFSIADVFSPTWTLVALAAMSFLVAAMYLWFMGEEFWKVFPVGGLIFIGLVLFVLLYSAIIRATAKRPS
jgi:hypothetical protein